MTRKEVWQALSDEETRFVEGYQMGEAALETHWYGD